MKRKKTKKQKTKHGCKCFDDVRHSQIHTLSRHFYSACLCKRWFLCVALLIIASEVFCFCSDSALIVGYSQPGQEEEVFS